MDYAAAHGVKILPVDSEHSAVFQCLQAKGDSGRIGKLILTASGGPFFGKSREELAFVRPEDALRHPTWTMGRKVTVDSATMMNKGLEIMEAAHLFGVTQDKIEVIISSGEHGALDGRVYRSFGARPAWRPGYAHADSVCADVAGAPAKRCKAD
jgi:1-deoxy-D-xylulose 5-phosphate reductoisomerase